MKKKMLSAALAASMLLGITACSSSSDVKLTIGGLASTNSEKSGYQTLLPQVVEGEYRAVEFNSLTELTLAIDNGKIDAIGVPSTTAAYIAQQKEGYVVRAANAPISLQMAVSNENQSLRDRLNSAIATLTDNGTLPSLIDTLITNLENGTVPATDEIEAAPNATETIKVGVTGDLPPLDYVSADGKPQGFNVAFLSEIGKQLGVNIELVQVSSEARTVALASGKIDVIFWVRSYDNAKAVETEKLDFLLTDRYFTDVSAMLAKKDDLERLYKILADAAGAKDSSAKTA